MKKIKQFMKKPITWGGYIKLCVCAGIIGATYSAFIIFGLWKNMVVASDLSDQEES